MKGRLILLGPPGSGKGTYAKRLKNDFGLTHVSSGHWLRAEIERGSPVGRRVREFLDKGDLVPDAIVLEFMEQRLLPELNGPGFLLDGFPRTLGQAKALDEWLKERGREIEEVILLDCDADLLLDRISGRRVCTKCGANYHARSQPPRRDGWCDACGGELARRDDDTEAVLRKRLQVYEELTKPLVEYYRESGRLVVLDASLPVETGYQRLAATLKS